MISLSAVGPVLDINCTKLHWGPWGFPKRLLQECFAIGVMLTKHFMFAGNSPKHAFMFYNLDCFIISSPVMMSNKDVYYMLACVELDSMKNCLDCWWSLYVS